MDGQAWCWSEPEGSFSDPEHRVGHTRTEKPLPCPADGRADVTVYAIRWSCPDRGCADLAALSG